MIIIFFIVLILFKSLSNYSAYLKSVYRHEFELLKMSKSLELTSRSSIQLEGHYS